MQARRSCGALRRMPFWTLRVLLTTQSVGNCIPTLEREERSSQLSCPMLCASARRAWVSLLTKMPVRARRSCGALRRMPFWTLRVLLTTQSVENCIPTLQREERSSQLSCPMLCASARRAWVSLLTKVPVQARLSCGALRRTPFWTLRVLLTTQSVENCIPTLEREERSSFCGSELAHERDGSNAPFWGLVPASS